MTELMNTKAMLIICHGLHSRKISTQLNTSGRFWMDMLASVLDLHHQNANGGKIFKKHGVRLSTKVPETPRIDAKAH